MTNSSKKKWFSFSIRKLLIFVTIVAIFWAWLSHLSFFEFRKSRSSANVIQAAGGTVSWSDDTIFRDATFPCIAIVELQDCELTDDVYAVLAVIPDYFALHIGSESFDQDAMRKLAEVQYLSGLFLDPGPVAETSIRQFQNERPDIMVTVGFLGGSSFREYPRIND
jgi:hypothetical protein